MTLVRVDRADEKRRPRLYTEEKEDYKIDICTYLLHQSEVLSPNSCRIPLINYILPNYYFFFANINETPFFTNSFETSFTGIESF
jgi:hypothetical protein